MCCLCVFVLSCYLLFFFVCVVFVYCSIVVPFCVCLFALLFFFGLMCIDCLYRFVLFVL